MNSIPTNNIDPNLDIAPIDTYFIGGGLDDATATYLAAATIIPIMLWLFWRNRKNMDQD
jgi:hypothetical protein